jgi:hypothetical protein
VSQSLLLPWIKPRSNVPELSLHLSFFGLGFVFCFWLGLKQVPGMDSMTSYGTPGCVLDIVGSPKTNREGKQEKKKKENKGKKINLVSFFFFFLYF